MECRRGLAMRILSVCPSVCLSVCHTRELWQNGRKICPDLYTIRKNIYPSFLRRRMAVGGRPLLREILGQPTNTNCPCVKCIRKNFVEDIYILLIILYYFAGSVSTTANTNCPCVKCIRKKDTSRLKLNWCRIELSLTIRYSIPSNFKHVDGECV